MFMYTYNVYVDARACMRVYVCIYTYMEIIFICIVHVFICLYVYMLRARTYTYTYKCRVCHLYACICESVIICIYEEIRIYTCIFYV